MSGQGSGGNVLAALCSLFIPGLGQLLQGRLFIDGNYSFRVCGCTMGHYARLDCPFVVYY
jgi:hypothetical protein